MYPFWARSKIVAVKALVFGSVSCPIRIETSAGGSREGRSKTCFGKLPTSYSLPYFFQVKNQATAQIIKVRIWMTSQYLVTSMIICSFPAAKIVSLTKFSSSFLISWTVLLPSISPKIKEAGKIVLISIN